MLKLEIHCADLIQCKPRQATRGYSYIGSNLSVPGVDLMLLSRDPYYQNRPQAIRKIPMASRNAGIVELRGKEPPNAMKSTWDSVYNMARNQEYKGNTIYVYTFMKIQAGELHGRGGPVRLRRRRSSRLQ